jgi:acyl carrier protein
MNSLEDFVTILQDDLGLNITVADVGKDLDQVPGWDSAHLLQLMSTLEQETGHSVALPDLLSATSLKEMYERATGN